jgi:nicotinamide riboside transporter PnuC
MTSRREKEFNRGAGLLALWTGLLAGPLVWLMQLQAAYVLVGWACKSNSQLLLYLVTLVALLLVAGAGLLSWRCWKQTGRDWPNEAGGVVPRSRFMAVLGVLTSALFFVLILAQGIPNFIFTPCMR